MNDPTSFRSGRAHVATWLAVALLSTLASIGPTGLVALAVAGAALVLALPGPWTIRLAAAAAMAPAAFVDAPAWAFALAGAVLASAVATAAREGAAEADAGPASLRHLQRHLEWCRRRDERAHALWISTDNEGDAAAAMGVFRVTDSVALLQEDGRGEIVALIDNLNFVREGLERRLRERIEVACQAGWAGFPEDGVTLDTLYAHARAESRAIEPGRHRARDVAIGRVARAEFQPSGGQS